MSRTLVTANDPDSSGKRPAAYDLVSCSRSSRRVQPGLEAWRSRRVNRRRAPIDVAVSVIRCGIGQTTKVKEMNMQTRGGR